MRRSPRRLRPSRVPLARPPAPRATTTAAPARRAGQPSSRRPPQPVRRWPRADWSCRSRRDPRTTTPKTAALWPREPPGQAQARRPDPQSTDAGAIPGPRRACHPEAVSRPWRPSQYSREPAPSTLRHAGLTRRGRTGAAPADDGTGIDRLPTCRYAKHQRERLETKGPRSSRYEPLRSATGGPPVARSDVTWLRSRDAEQWRPTVSIARRERAGCKEPLADTAARRNRRALSAALGVSNIEASFSLGTAIGRDPRRPRRTAFADGRPRQILSTPGGDAVPGGSNSPFSTSTSAARIQVRA